MEGCHLQDAAKGQMNAVPGGIGEDEDELAPGVEADGHKAIVLCLEVLDALQFGRPPEPPLVICPAPTHSQSCSVHKNPTEIGDISSHECPGVAVDPE